MIYFHNKIWNHWVICSYFAHIDHCIPVALLLCDNIKDWSITIELITETNFKIGFSPWLLNITISLRQILILTSRWTELARRWVTWRIRPIRFNFVCLPAAGKFQFSNSIIVYISHEFYIEFPAAHRYPWCNAQSKFALSRSPRNSSEQPELALTKI